MELPIQLKFFKKLELYQELKFQNKKAKMADDPNRWKIWNTEKEILKWTVEHHHHLNSQINHKDVRKSIFKLSDKICDDPNNINKLELNKEEKEKYNNIDSKFETALTKTFGNLIQRGYVSQEESYGGWVKFTKEGLLMGEVIYDVEEGNIWNRNKYWLFYLLVWGTVFAGVLTVIINFFKLIF